MRRHQNGMGGGGCSVKTKPESTDMAMEKQQAQRGAECIPGAGSQEYPHLGHWGKNMSFHFLGEKGGREKEEGSRDSARKGRYGIESHGGIVPGRLVSSSQD